MAFATQTLTILAHAVSNEILGCEVFSSKSEVPNPFLSEPKLSSAAKAGRLILSQSVSLLFQTVEGFHNDARSPARMPRSLCIVSLYVFPIPSKASNQHGSS